MNNIYPEGELRITDANQLHDLMDFSGNMLADGHPTQFQTLMRNETIDSTFSQLTKLTDEMKEVPELGLSSDMDFGAMIKDQLDNCPQLSDIVQSFLTAFGVSKEDFISQTNQVLPEVCKAMNINSKKLTDTSRIIFSIVNNEVLKVADFLTDGIDPNAVVRKNKSLIHFCRSMEMLELLISHGLDLSINKPLLWVPMKVFKSLIKEYKADPYEYCDELDSSHKQAYVNRMLKQDRASLKSRLNRRLPSDLGEIVVDMFYPVVMRLGKRTDLEKTKSDFINAV